jgi:uncharacterized protein involved in exopolysaccharide biosynthesis
MELRTDTRAGLADEQWGLPWRDILRSTFRHRQMIALFGLIAASLMFLGKFLEPPMYQARSTLMLVANRADVKVSPEDRSVPQPDRIDEILVNSEATWLRSDAVVRDALEPWRAKLEAERASARGSLFAAVIRLPLGLPGTIYRRLHGVAEPTAFEDWVTSIQGRLDVSPVRLSNVIQLSYTDENPEFSAEVVKALIAYRMKRQASFSQQDEAVNFYDEQSKLLAERVRQAEEALQAFYQREGIVGGVEERKALRDRLAEIRTARARAVTEAAEAKMRAGFLQKALHEVPQRVEVPNSAGGSMQSRVLELMLERSKLLSRYAPTSVKIVDLDLQIAEAKRLLQEEKKLIAETAAARNPTYADLEKELIQTQALLVALDARTAALSEEEHGYLDQMQRLVKGTSTLEHLETDLDRAKEAHRTYIGKREDARFSSALDASQILNITVAEPATVPSTPLPARPAINAVLGALAGLVVGVSVAFARDLIDPTVKSVAEVGRLTGVPVLGEVSS